VSWAAWAVVALAAAPPQVRVEAGEEGRHRVSLVGLDDAQRAALGPADERKAALSVYAGAVGPATPAMAGAYELDGEGLHFAPLFRFSPGVTYTARGRLGALRLERTFEVAAVARTPPEVAGIFPSGESLPANTLRLYVQFSRPMTRNDSTRRVHLLDDAGQEVPLAFVDVDGGLWDPSRTRLTLFFHPGRVKRGVAPGERMGPPLRAGRAYRIVVDGAMTDASGVPLGRPFEHRFRVVEADREPPIADGLVVTAPERPDSPLVVRLPEPLDHALLRRWVWVDGADGARVPGREEVADAETRWVFTPDRPWTPGAYAVRVQRALEDRAGNRFDRAFDRDAAGPDPGTASDEPESSGTLRLPFVVR
jgi:hypothetical protein